MLVDIEGTAELLDLEPYQVTELAKSGAMPQPVDVGGEQRWRFDEIRNWVAMRCPRMNGPEVMVAASNQVEHLVPTTVVTPDRA